MEYFRDGAGGLAAFLEMLRAALPDLIGLLQKARLWAGAETHIVYSLYDRLRSADFSIKSCQVRQLVCS